MTKNYFILFFSLFLLSVQSQDQYYVTTVGSSANDGLTENTAWDITTAVARAVAGDTVWIKSGTYNSPILNTSNAGTIENPIVFIGYKNNIGDIVSALSPTYTEDMYISDNRIMKGIDMPLFNNSRGEDETPNTTDIAWSINHDYIHLVNIKIQYYWIGVSMTSGTRTGLKFSNIIGNEFGNWDPSNNGWDKPFSLTPPTGNLSGQGFYGINVINSVWENCSIFDAGAASYFLVNSDSLEFNGCQAYSTRSGNASDYLFDFATVTNSTLKNYIAKRYDLDTSKMHLSRAVMLQLQSRGNLIENGTHINTRTQVEVQSTNNTFRNINVIGNGKGNQGNIQISGESDDNLFYNWTIDNTEGIQFLGAGDSRQPGVSHAYSGQNNYFINFKITNVPAGTGNAIFSFHRLGFGETDDSGTNYIIGLTADNSVALVNTNRTGTLNIYNSTFTNVNNYDTASTSGPSTDELVQLNFFNCNFYNNGFTTPANSPERSLVNTISVDPLFTNAAIGDYTLQAGSGLIDKGMDASIINFDAGKDFTGVERIFDYDIGAYEYLNESINTCNTPNPSSGLSPNEVTVSDFQINHGPCNLMDNDFHPESRWSADGDGQWAQFDLGSPQEFDQLQIAFHLGNSRNSYFDIQISNDAQAWISVLTGAQASGTSLTLENFNFPLQNARYVRYLGHGNSQANNNWNSITELRINKTTINVENIIIEPEDSTIELGKTQTLTFAITPANATNQSVVWSSSDTSIATVDANGLVTAVAVGTATITATTNDDGFADTTNIIVENSCVITNVALGSTASQSSTYGSGVAALAIDGNTTGESPWSADLQHTNNEATPWWQLDLGGEHTIDHLKIFNRSNRLQSRLNNFYVFVSDAPFTATASLDDLRNDASIFEYFFNGVAGLEETLTLNTEGRYIRIQLANNGILHMAEVQVMGCLITGGVSGLTAYIAPSSFLELSPVPTNSTLNVNYFFANDSESTVQLTIFDNIGRQIKTAIISPKDFDGQFNISEISAGSYLLRLTKGDEVVIKRFVVRR